MGGQKLYKQFIPELEELGIHVLSTGSYPMISNHLKCIDPAALERWVEDHYLSAPDWELELVQDYLQELREKGKSWDIGRVEAGVTKKKRSAFKASRKPVEKRSLGEAGQIGFYKKAA